MSIFQKQYRDKTGNLRRVKNWTTNFWINGTHYEFSTKCPTRKDALKYERTARTALERGEPWPPRAVVVEAKPTVGKFLTWRVYRWAVGRFKRTCPNSYQWYRSSIRAINSYAPLRDTPLDKLGSEVIAQFAAFRREKRKSINTINGNLRALRASLTLAQEQGLIVTVPKVRFLSGELRRDRVLTENEMQEYLAVCAPGALGECDSLLLADVVTILADTGMRRGELFGMMWEAVSFELGRCGMLYVVAGKTSSARRPIPMTQRVGEILLRRWNEAGQPMIGNIFPADTASGHVEESTVRKGHKKALALSGVRPFSFHVLRHTFLTKLGACGIDSFSLARIAGHTSPRMTARYIHPTDATIVRALEGFQQVNRLPALAAAQRPQQ